MVHETTTNLVPATKWGWDTLITGDMKGFMIFDDKKFSVIMGNGERANFPAGTFNTKTRYDIVFLKILHEASELDIKSIWIFTND